MKQPSYGPDDASICKEDMRARARSIYTYIRSKDGVEEHRYIPQTRTDQLEEVLGNVSSGSPHNGEMTVCGRALNDLFSAGMSVPVFDTMQNTAYR